GGWSGCINAKAKPQAKDAAYALFSYMSSPAISGKDVTIGITGFNPYRVSHFKNLKLWTDAGFSEAAAKNYLGAIEASLTSPNMILDLRIPKTQQYQQVVLDKALAEFLAGQLSIQQAMDQIYSGWEEITNAEGRERQKQAYRASLSIER
ncbi:hypothetical protein, partial [Acinetobacter pittii]|uniref:hypothetical protein n=1 Tax=Acinetobacter pittii TaxID=48296 RepID=UPI002278F41A